MSCSRARVSGPFATRLPGRAPGRGRRGSAAEKSSYVGQEGFALRDIGDALQECVDDGQQVVRCDLADREPDVLDLLLEHEPGGRSELARERLDEALDELVADEIRRGRLGDVGDA